MIQVSQPYSNKGIHSALKRRTFRFKEIFLALHTFVRSQNALQASPFLILISVVEFSMYAPRYLKSVTFSIVVPSSSEICFPYDALAMYLVLSMFIFRPTCFATSFSFLRCFYALSFESSNRTISSAKSRSVIKVSGSRFV